MLIDQKAWIQYLEVGIGPDAEVFDKPPILAASGALDGGPHPIDLEQPGAGNRGRRLGAARSSARRSVTT